MNKTLKENREMKDSGIEWLGEIPKSWEIRRLRYLVNIKTGSNDTIDAVADGAYPFYVRSPKIERINTYTYDGEAILMAGDGVGAGKVFHYVNGKFACHQRVYNLHQLKDINGKFLYYYLKENFSKEVEKGTAKSTVDSIRLPMIKDFTIVLPSLYEQQVIANYLDEKVGKIDQLIAEQNQAVENWKAYKQSLITEVLTKGLNPNTEMRDSGIEWIGEIPKDWALKKLKYLFVIKKEIAGKSGFDILSVTQHGIKIKDITTNEGQISSDYSKYQLVDKGDFVMNHMDLLTGWVDYSHYDGVTSPDYRVFKLKDYSKCSPKYYLYIMQMCYKNKIFYGLGQGVSNLGRWRLQTDKFLNFFVPTPSLVEQQEIVDYLDNKCLKIDQIIEQKQALIKQLQEYKQSLIYECVTGKRCVRKNDYSLY